MVVQYVVKKTQCFIYLYVRCPLPLRKKLVGGGEIVEGYRGCRMRLVKSVAFMSAFFILVSFIIVRLFFPALCSSFNQPV